MDSERCIKVDITITPITDSEAHTPILSPTARLARFLILWFPGEVPRERWEAVFHLSRSIGCDSGAALFSLTNPYLVTSLPSIAVVRGVR